MQLHLRNTFTPISFEEIPVKDRPKVLESHFFMEEKRYGTVKARMVAGGDNQRVYTDKDLVVSQTCRSEIIMVASVIDSHEKRDVAIVDIPNEFVQTDIQEFLIGFGNVFVKFSPSPSQLSSDVIFPRFT